MCPFCRVHFECCCFLQCVQHIVPDVSRPYIWIQESHMTRYIVNPINPWPLVTLNFFGDTYFEYIQHFTHWAHCDQILPNIQNVPNCLPIGYIGVRWLGTFKMYSVCACWAYPSHITGYIQNILSIWSLGILESHVDCDLNVFTMYSVGIWAFVPSVS